MSILYKAQILSYVEYSTAAIYHVCDSALALLDSMQDKILRAAGKSKVDALNSANLAPLECDGISLCWESFNLQHLA